MIHSAALIDLHRDTNFNLRGVNYTYNQATNKWEAPSGSCEGIFKSLSHEEDLTISGHTITPTLNTGKCIFKAKKLNDFHLEYNFEDNVVIDKNDLGATEIPIEQDPTFQELVTSLGSSLYSEGNYNTVTKTYNPSFEVTGNTFSIAPDDYNPNNLSTADIEFEVETTSSDQLLELAHLLHSNDIEFVHAALYLGYSSYEPSFGETVDVYPFVTNDYSMPKNLLGNFVLNDLFNQIRQRVVLNDNYEITLKLITGFSQVTEEGIRSLINIPNLTGTIQIPSSLDVDRQQLQSVAAAKPSVTLVFDLE